MKKFIPSLYLACLSTLLFACLSTPIATAQVRQSVTIFGDSYSTFEGYVTPDTMELWYFEGDTKNRTDVCKVRQTWWWQVLNRGGYKLARNNSYSGSTICNTGYDGKDYTHRSFLTRHDALGNPDIILIFGGTNDAWAHAPLGEFKYDKINSADKYSFRPALALLLTKMQERYPNVELYYIVNCDLEKDYTESMITICEHYGVSTIVLHDVGKRNGHPTIAGMKAIADQVLAALQQ